VHLRIGPPGLSREKLDLYHRYHAHQAAAKGWPSHDDVDPASYFGSFVLNPFPTQEWCYYLGGRLVGVGYVDDLSVGLSAIYFFYDPDYRDHSLGTWNVLSLIDRSRVLGRAHLYLGYYVADCGSLAYKMRYMPNQVLTADGRWVDFRDEALD
jgi:arginine-tRNA-protein transferase